MLPRILNKTGCYYITLPNKIVLMKSNKILTNFPGINRKLKKDKLEES